MIEKQKKTNLKKDSCVIDGSAIFDVMKEMTQEKFPNHEIKDVIERIQHDFSDTKYFSKFEPKSELLFTVIEKINKEMSFKDFFIHIYKDKLTKREKK